MKIDRIEVRVTDYTARLQRTTMHGAYDTGPSGQMLGKPVLLRATSPTISPAAISTSQISASQ